ncbi:MAG TPA: hypothetical protein V6C76_02980 [Drouetiella sp.]
MSCGNGWQSGFDSLVKKRATFQHHWIHLQALRNQAANREAAEIVKSFQAQMDYEQYQERVELVAS